MNLDERIKVHLLNEEVELVSWKVEGQLVIVFFWARVGVEKTGHEIPISNPRKTTDTTYIHVTTARSHP
jgi:hypothetical protein